MVFMSENEFYSTITIIADQHCFVRRFCIAVTIIVSTEGVSSTSKYIYLVFILLHNVGSTFSLRELNYNRKTHSGIRVLKDLKQ